MVVSLWRSSTAARRKKTERTILRTLGWMKLQVVAREAEPRTDISGHQLSLDLRVLAMAAQAAHAAVFELDSGTELRHVPQFTAASELRQAVIDFQRMHQRRRHCDYAVVTAFAIARARAQRRR